MCMCDDRKSGYTPPLQAGFEDFAGFEACFPYMMPTCLCPTLQAACFLPGGCATVEGGCDAARPYI
jgi:hypothetical protein